jgi:hypothetical protein
MEITTGVVPADWIKRIVDDERKRDAVRVRDEETAARKAELVRLNGRRLLDELRSAVARDVEAFRSEFAGDPRRDIVLGPTEGPDGFVVRKPASPAVTLTVTAHLDTAAMDCDYRFTSTNGLPPREDRLELVFAANGEEALQIKTQRTGQVFANADALSEYLLGPVFTGRPR